MKVVLLAGGFGTRLAEYTEAIPKPMVPIGGRPIRANGLFLAPKVGRSHLPLRTRVHKLGLLLAQRAVLDQCFDHGLRLFL